METRINKNRLIETLRIERARWDMLLVQVDSDRMTLPGVEGDLSVRDILAEVVTYERWAAGQLCQAVDEEPTPSVPSGERTFSASVGDLMSESRRAFEQILRSLMRLPEEDIFSPQRFEWTGGQPVAAFVPGYTFEHYRKYDKSIRAWMKRKRRSSRRPAV